MERSRRGRSAASTPAKKEAPKETKKEAPPPKKEEEKKMEVDPPKVEEKKETPAPVEEKPAEEAAPAEDNADKDISNGQNDTQGDANEDEDEDDEDDETHREDGDKVDDDKSLIVKIKGLPKVGTNKMHLLLHDLFSSKLEIPLPLVRHPKGNKDKWIYAECQSLEDKKKILSTLNGSYKYKEKDGTVEYSLQAAPGWVYTEQKSAEPLDMESALDILFKYRKMPYKEQLATKTEETEKMMKEIFDGLKKINTRYARIIEKFPTVNKTVPMIPTIGYNFDCSFTIEVDPETKKVVVGLRASNRTAERVVPIDLCPNIPKIMADAVKDFVDHLDEYGLKPFDRNTETGNIVGVQCKMSTSCEIIMSVLVPKENTFLKEFLPIKTPEEVNKAIEERKKEMEARAAAKAEAEAKAKAEAEAKAKAEAEAKEKKTEGEEKKEEAKEEEKKEETAAEDKDKSDAKDESKADDSVALIEMDDEEKPTDEEKAKYGRQLKEIKPGLLKYFQERGKDLGIVSIFSNWILYNRRGDWAGRQHFYHHICGATTVKEQIINLQYDLWPYKQWSPRTSTFGTILNTIDSLVQLDKSTSIAVASEFRLVALYYAKRCRDVLSVLSWSGKSSNQMHVRYIHKQGVKNIEFVSTKASAFKALDRTNFARTSEPRVAIVWGFSKAGLLRKFHNMGVKRIITVYHVRGNVQPDLKKYLEAVAPHMAVTKVTPVDTQPHGGQYALVFLLEEVMGSGPVGQKRKMNEPMHMGAKRKRPPPLMHDSRKGAWDSGPMGPPMQSAVDPLNSTISQLTGFMQSQMLFNEMMKAGIQEILPQRDQPARAASPPPKYGGGGRSSWGGRGSRDGGGRFAEDYTGREYNGRDGSPGRWGNKRDEGFGRRNSPKSLTDAVWGPQNANLSMEDRRSYANRPPNWGGSVEKPGSYDKPQSFNNRYDRGDNYNYDRRDNKRSRDGGNWNRY